MSKVIIFSRNFPAYHPRKGEPTYFVEKLFRSIYGTDLPRIHQFDGIDRKEKEFILSQTPKHHTIRSGNRWKVGDKFSPRFWSGKPYNSKQIIIAPDIEVKKVWDFEIDNNDIFINGKSVHDNDSAFLESNTLIKEVAHNDGLTCEELLKWFQYPKSFTGQIICWNDSVNY